MPKIIDRSGWVLLPRGQFQKGWIERVSGKQLGIFRTYWRLPDGAERQRKERVHLGALSMPKKEAERLLIEKMKEFFTAHLTPSGPSAPVPSEADFSALLDKVWMARNGDWKPNTKRANQMYFDILKEKLGSIPIREFATTEMQDYLRGWLHEMAARNLSKSYIQHLLIYIRTALNEAVKRRLVHYNYASELKVPARTRPVDERFLEESQIVTLVKHFRNSGQGRDALIVLLFYACALRPGELFALRWNDWDEDRAPSLLRIDESFGKSGLGSPKTKRSHGVVHLPPGLHEELRRWKLWCGNIDPDAYIFESKRNTPIKYDNFLKRVLQPAAAAVGIGAITHQMFRRSFSTTAIDGGASPKDVQAQMRHTQVNMSLFYAKAIPKSVAEEVDRLSDRLLAKCHAVSKADE